MVMTSRLSVHTSDDDEKLVAFRNLMEYSRKHPFPKKFDTDKLREKAIMEKYGQYVNHDADILGV